LIFIPEPFIEYIDDDNNTIAGDDENKNNAIMPYSGFLSFPSEDEQKKEATAPKVEILTANPSNITNSTSSIPKKKRAVVSVKN
jgi:hypothetical protein